MGSIPVIIADGYEKPNVRIDWNDFSVSIKENEIADIESILKGYSPTKIKSMQHTIKNIYAQFFKNENLHRIVVNKIRQ